MGMRHGNQIHFLTTDHLFILELTKSKQSLAYTWFLGHAQKHGLCGQICLSLSHLH